MTSAPPWARALAVSAGIAPEQVDELWYRHCEMVDRDPGPPGPDQGSYGGPRWKGLVQLEAKSPRVPTVKRDDPMMEAQRRAEREARALEEAEYRKGAVSLEDWLSELRSKPDFHEEVTPIESHLVAFRARYANETSWEWLMAATASFP